MPTARFRPSPTPAHTRGSATRSAAAPLHLASVRRMASWQWARQEGAQSARASDPGTPPRLRSSTGVPRCILQSDGRQRSQSAIELKSLERHELYAPRRQDQAKAATKAHPHSAVSTNRSAADAKKVFVVDPSTGYSRFIHSFCTPSISGRLHRRLDLRRGAH